jgi:hypothetical protein
MLSSQSYKIGNLHQLIMDQLTLAFPVADCDFTTELSHVIDKGLAEPVMRYCSLSTTPTVSISSTVIDATLIK